MENLLLLKVTDQPSCSIANLSSYQTSETCDTINLFLISTSVPNGETSETSCICTYQGYHSCLAPSVPYLSATPRLVTRLVWNTLLTIVIAVLKEILKFFLELFQSLRTEVGAEFASQTIGCALVIRIDLPR